MIKKVQPRPGRKPGLEDAISRLEAACARAERSSREVLDKLWQWGIEGEQADRIVEDLKARRFVDDARYARAFVNDKVKFARWGRHKVVAALYRKRIDAEIIDEALESIDEDVYRSNLEHIIKHKAATIPDLQSREGRAKLIRHAISNGYETSMVLDTIRAVLSSPDD